MRIRVEVCWDHFQTQNYTLETPTWEFLKGLGIRVAMQNLLGKKIENNVEATFWVQGCG